MREQLWKQRLATLLEEDADPDPFAELAVAGVVLSDQDNRCSAKVRERRKMEIMQEFADLVALDDRGVLRSLLLYVFEQKIQCLLAATSIKEIAEIRKPQYPSNLHGKLKNGHPYPIPEEELVGWMIASATFPPNNQGVRRMEEIMLEISEKNPDDPLICKWKDYIAGFDE